MMKRMLSFILAATVLCAFSFDAFAEKPEHVLRIASLAPKGSTWYKSFEKTNREIKKATGGKVAFKLYGGGVMGDEGAMVKKMRFGQLDGGAVTSVGMGEIAPELLVLQLPLTFKNNKELDYVREKMTPTFTKILEEKGFVLLMWGDVGFNYIFSNSPVSTPEDIKSTKMWVWDQDPISKKVMEVAGANGTLLGVPDVLPSLSTGVIDAYSNSPYGAVALQWHTKAKYVTDLKLAVVIGGLIVSKKSWEKIPEADRAKIMKITNANGEKLLKAIRADNKKAIKTITAGGVKSVKAENMKAWMATAKKVEAALTGSLFSAELVKEMKTHLKAAR